jgi:hypothetical protein
MPSIESALDETLYEKTMYHLSRLGAYTTGATKRAARAKQTLLAIYQDDPVFSIFGLDSTEYIAAALSGGTITSIHRKLGDIYEDSVATIIAHVFKQTAEQIKYTASIQVDEKVESRTIDAYIQFDRLTPALRRRALAFADKQLESLTRDLRVEFKAIGLEVRHCYQTGDSKRKNADLAMARHLLLSGILPVIPFFCKQSNEGIIRAYELQATWIVKQGLDSYQLIKDLTGYDYFDFLKRNRSEFRKPVITILGNLQRGSAKPSSDE